jgi:Domain of unknown function (DU1801)
MAAMKRAAKKTVHRDAAAERPRAGFSDPAVEAVFGAYLKPLRAKLLALRRLIFETAKATKGVGALQETLKWGQPSYLTAETGSGSTIRIDQVKSGAKRYAVYFHRQTDLVETFRELYPTELSFGGNRSMLLEAGDELPHAALRHCIALALTYHLNKTQGGAGEIAGVRRPAPRPCPPPEPNPRRTAPAAVRRSRRWAARG